MLKFSRIAFAAALMAGSAGLVASPAFAAKKEEKPAGAPQLKIGEEVRKAYMTAQTSLTAKDVAATETNVAAVEAAAKTDDERYVGQNLRLNLEVLKLQAAGNAAGSEASLAAPLDALIANPSTPKAELVKYLYLRGTLAFNGRQYPVALDLFTRAKAAGSTEAELPLMMVKAKVETGDVAGGLAELDGAMKAEVAAGRPAPEDWYRYAIAKSNAAALKNPAAHGAAVDWMQRYVKAYPTAKNWRDVLITYGFDANSPKMSKAQTVDLFRLMRATKSLDQSGYQEYAGTLLDNLGLPAEAKTVIEEGRANGKIPAGGAAQILTDANTAAKADTAPAVLEKRAATAANGQAAAQTGDSYLGLGNYAKAAEMYRLALQKGVAKGALKNSVGPDDVNMHLGIALALSGDKAGARTAFAAVTAAPSNEIASFWTVWLDAPAV